MRAARALAFFAGQARDYEYDSDIIREELIEEFHDEAGERLAVITRNRYGALVLNTERVLFGDIDVPSESFVQRLCNRFGRRARDKHYFLEAMRAFHAAHPEFVLEVYETRAGLRFMVVNREIRPGRQRGGAVVQGTAGRPSLHPAVPQPGVLSCTADAQAVAHRPGPAHRAFPFFVAAQAAQFQFLAGAVRGKIPQYLCGAAPGAHRRGSRAGRGAGGGGHPRPLRLRRRFEPGVTS
ncbi:MAG: hypothetical protein IPM80_00810 [Proteobacteria bacterium]|nr:hypothetical protein [Pseudomonadota bacterium]